MELRNYDLQLEGASPLIMHWDNLNWADQMSEERTRIKETDKKAFKAGDDRCPAHTWKGCVYHDSEHVAMPNDNLRSCLMKAGARITLDGKKTYKELTQCGMIFEEEYLQFLSNGKPLPWKAVDKIHGPFIDHVRDAETLGFKLFVKRAAVGQAKHVRVRPRFDKWTVRGTLTLIDDQWTEEVLQKLFDIAGRYIGLCDWRPGSKSSPGPYGRFLATLKAA